MLTIVDFPTIVQEALAVFGNIFDTEAARRHFAEYLTGLMIAERKTVSGINREFALTTNQSCLNRWLTEVEWDVQTLNDRRLAWLQQVLQTRYNSRGVIAIDNTLVDHEGKLIEDVGWFWDHADARHVIAHDYLISNYVCPSGAHYPIEWRRFKKRVVGPEGTFKDHAALCIELIDDAMQRAIPGDFTFDSYFTSTKVLNPMFKGANRPRRFFGLKALHTMRRQDPTHDTQAGGEAGDHRLASPLAHLSIIGPELLVQTKPTPLPLLG
jgi:hypothetical protein